MIALMLVTSENVLNLVWLNLKSGVIQDYTIWSYMLLLFQDVGLRVRQQWKFRAMASWSDATSWLSNMGSSN